MAIAPTEAGPGAPVRIVNQIACEIREQPGYSHLVAGNYFISAIVTITAEDKGALTPSMSFIDLFGRAGNTYTSAIGGEISRTRTRVFTQTFTIRARDVGCTEGAAMRFEGSLGVGEVIRAGLQPLPIGVTGAAEDATFAAFGSTIEFKIVRSLNGGPTWVRPMFKGANGSNGLASLSRTDTDKLVITFAPPKAKPAKSIDLLMSEVDRAADRDSSAAEASRDLLQTMVLQNLNPDR